MILEYPWDTNWAAKCYILWSVFKARLIRERNLCSLIMHLVSSWTWFSFYERSRRCPWMTLAGLYVLPTYLPFAWFFCSLARLPNASPDVIYGRILDLIVQLDTKCRIRSYVILLLSLFLSFFFLSLQPSPTTIIIDLSPSIKLNPKYDLESHTHHAPVWICTFSNLLNLHHHQIGTSTITNYEMCYRKPPHMPKQLSFSLNE